MRRRALFGVAARASGSAQQICSCHMPCISQDSRHGGAETDLAPGFLPGNARCRGGDRCENGLCDGVLCVFRVGAEVLYVLGGSGSPWRFQKSLWGRGLRGGTRSRVAGGGNGWPYEGLCVSPGYVLALAGPEGVRRGKGGWGALCAGPGSELRWRSCIKIPLLSEDDLGSPS